MVLYIEYRHCSWNVVQVMVILRVAYIDKEKMKGRPLRNIMLWFLTVEFGYMYHQIMFSSITVLTFQKLFIESACSLHIQVTLLYFNSC
jgi:hypothetical protein